MMIVTTQQNMTREPDLGVSSRPPRNWKGICIAVVVIVVVMSLVILSIILLTPGKTPQLTPAHPSSFQIPDWVGQDLGVSSRPPRNWKGICIAVVVIVVVMSLVILSIILLTPEESRLSLQSRFSLEDLAREEFKVHDPAVTWVSESEVTLRTREGHVIKHNMKTNESTTLVENSTFLTLKASRFQVSPDLRFVLLAYNVQPMHSQSFSASYAIYSVDTREISELNPPEVKRSVLQFASWGPHGNQLVYVFENNIYYQPDASSSAQRLVSTGKEGVLLNGVSDWLYEEEVLQSYAAHWWSGDGARLAYLTINNSATPNMEIPHFLGGAYPSSSRYPYPKAGQPIPTVRLFVVNLYGLAHTLELIPPDSFRTREYYLSMVKWISSTSLAVRWLTRPQSQSALTICEATTGACLEKHKMTSDAWITKQQEEPLFSQDGSTFFLTLPVKQGARGEFQHIALLSTQAAAPTTPSRFLTSGNWDVTSLCALDERRGKIYFLSTENSPRSRHLYSVDVAGVFRRACVTCDLIADCTFFRAQFSPNMTSFTLQCGGPGVPKVSVHQTDDPSNYFILEDNEALEEALRGKRLPEKEFQTIPADGYDLQLKLSLPVGYKDRVHPLLLVVSAAEAVPASGVQGPSAPAPPRCVSSRPPVTDSGQAFVVRAHRKHAGKEAFQPLCLLCRAESNPLLLLLLQIHPDEGHALQSDRSRQHLIRTLVRYFLGCLQNPRRRSSERQEDEY
ncbi:UNVERIFIED_CONTAM: hypothetical protein FKN15_077976 [Acipenser sinensis]